MTQSDFENAFLLHLAYKLNTILVKVEAHIDNKIFYKKKST